MFNQTEILLGKGEGERIRKLTGTMQNLFDIEENVGSIYSLRERCRLSYGDKPIDVTQALKLKEIRDILFYALHGDSESPLKKESIEAEIQRRGQMYFLLPIIMFLREASMGGEAQEKGEVAPAAGSENPTS